MLTTRAAVRAWSALAVAALGALPVGLACSSSDSGGILPGPQSPATGGQVASAAGSSTGGQNGVSGGGSPTLTAGTSTGGVVGGGGTAVATGGAAGGGVGGAAGGTATGGAGGLEPGDTAPVRPLNVMASKGEHVHGKAGLDTRAVKMLGKLVVDLGVNAGNYSSFLAKRGYHSMGAPCGSCPAPDLGDNRDDVGTCRLGEFDTTKANVTSQLDMLSAQYPEEDWGYFLNADGSVRWSDVAITGNSHGATTAAIAGRLGARMWRIVSRSGPRDNTCGLGNGQCTAPLSTPAYDAACPDADVASWLDKPSLTPMDRFYGIAGMTDGQCGDIMFDMHRTKYVGVPTIFDNAQAVLTGTNQFFAASVGHYDFLAAPNGVMRADEVLEIAFAIPPENRKPAF